MDLLSLNNLAPDDHYFVRKTYHYHSRYLDADPFNIAIQVAIYRWTHTDQARTMYHIGDLMEEMVSPEERPHWISERRVGLTTTRVLFTNYRVVRRVNGKRVWVHNIVDIRCLRHSLEYLMSGWLPWSANMDHGDVTGEWLRERLDRFASMEPRDILLIPDKLIKAQRPAFSWDQFFHASDEPDY